MTAPDASRLSSLLGIPFSEEQLDAITAPLTPSVVVAGAGSGKTTVMTARVVWLVMTGQVRPDEVLGLTFTTKAAGELSGRVRHALRLLAASDAADLPPWLADPDDDPGEPTVATYHAFAGRLLAEHGLRIGLEPGSRLLTEAASYQLAHRVVVRTARDVTVIGQALQTVVTNVRSLDGELAEHCLEPAALRARDLDFIADVDAMGKITADARDSRATALRRIELSHLVDEYRAARLARDVVDFSDQMRFGARLAEECPEVGEALRAQYRVVLLDEYQDTSVAQRRLLVGLFGGGHPVTAVGDPLQAIYGWRGASVENIDSFPVHFPKPDGSKAIELTLAENRRSGARILDAANEVAAPLRALHPQVAPLVAADPAKPPGAVRVALLPTYAEEVEWLADEVVAQIGPGGTEPSDIAILARASADFPALLRALADRGVAVEVRGVDGLLTVPEVVEVLSVLEVLHDSTANPALVRLLTGPRWRIGARDLALLGRRARQLVGGGRSDDDRDLDQQLDDAVAGVDPAEVVSLLDALEDPGDLPFDPEALARFSRLAEEVRRLRRHVGQPLADLVHRVVVTTGLDVELSAAPELLALRRAEGLQAFVDLVAAFRDAEGEASLGAFLAWLRLAERYEQVPELDRPPSPGAVQLMTIHRAKGLEWPVVVLPALTSGVFPSTMGRSRWPKSASTVPYDVRGDSASLPVLPGLAPKDFKAFVADCKTHDEREERRLMYVAATRAKRLLVASGSWWGPTQKKPRGPSAYLDELRDAALGGSGEVVAWAEAPADDDTNPAFSAPKEVSWPVVPDAAALERRHAAADAVLAALGADLDDLRAEHLALGALGADGPPSERVVPVAEPSSTPTRSGVPGDQGSLFDLDLSMPEQGELPEVAGPGGSPLLGLSADELEIVLGWDDDIALLLEERRSEQSSTRLVPVPSSLSASDLVRLAADEEGFTRTLARPLPSAPAPAARRGTRFHAWVEQHYGVHPLLEPDDLPGAADAEIDSDDDLAGLRETFLASEWAGRTPVEIEVPFSLVLGGRVVPGRIDAVFADVDAADGQLHYDVVDWKTSKKHSADPLQLAVYRVAYAELLGVPVERVRAAFVYVRDGATVRFDDLPDREALESLLLTP